jgi:hypothetical protein
MLMFVVSLTLVLACCELHMGIYRRGLIWQSHLATMDCVNNYVGGVPYACDMIIVY